MGAMSVSEYVLEIRCVVEREAERLLVCEQGQIYRIT
jgi:hypothetical protein